MVSETAIHIRAATLDDFDKVSDLYLQVQQLHVNLRPDLYCPVDTVITRESFEETIPNHNLWIAEIPLETRNDSSEEQTISHQNGITSPAGFMQLETRQIESPARYPTSVLYIHAICVDEKCRHSGVGRALMAKARELAAERGCTSVDLQVMACNDAAISFYQSLGFTPRSLNLEMPLPQVLPTSPSDLGIR